jgi:hypothetical protein
MEMLILLLVALPCKYSNFWMNIENKKKINEIKDIKNNKS